MKERQCATYKGRYMELWEDEGGQSIEFYDVNVKNISKNPPTTFSKKDKDVFLKEVEDPILVFLGAVEGVEQTQEICVKDLVWVDLDFTAEILDILNERS